MDEIAMLVAISTGRVRVHARFSVYGNKRESRANSLHVRYRRMDRIRRVVRGGRRIRGRSEKPASKKTIDGVFSNVRRTNRRFPISTHHFVGMDRESGEILQSGQRTLRNGFDYVEYIPNRRRARANNMHISRRSPPRPFSLGLVLPIAARFRLADRVRQSRESYHRPPTATAADQLQRPCDNRASTFSPTREKERRAPKRIDAVVAASSSDYDGYQQWE